MATGPNSTDQAVLEQAAKQIVADGMVKLSEYVNGTDPDPELVLKIVNSKVAEIGKTVPEKKADPHAGLPTVNIFIGRQGIQVEMAPSPPAPLEVVEEVPLELPAPVSRTEQEALVMQDLADMMELLP